MQFADGEVAEFVAALNEALGASRGVAIIPPPRNTRLIVTLILGRDQTFSIGRIGIVRVIRVGSDGTAVTKVSVTARTRTGLIE